MKAATLFILAMAMVIAIFSTAMFAQTITKDTTKSKATTTVVAKSSKPIGGRLYTQAQFESIREELKALADSEVVTVGVLRKAMGLTNDIVLKNGHKEYVSMPYFNFKKQVTKDVAFKLNTLHNEVGMAKHKVDALENEVNAVAEEVSTVAAKQAKTDSSLAKLVYVVDILEKSTTRMRWVLTEDKTQVPVPDGVRAVIRTEDATMKAEDAGMELLKLENAARKAAESGKK